MIKSSNKRISKVKFQNFKSEISPNLISNREDDLLMNQITSNYNLLIHPLITTCGITLNKIHFLEIGCGDGKYGLNISKYVKHYSGVDIRTESLEKAKETLKDQSNCNLYKNDGETLRQFEDNSQHLIFSYQTFFYLPSIKNIKSYLEEIFRVLNDKGIAKIQLSGPSMKKGFRLSWVSLARIDPLWKIFSFIPGNFQIPILRLKPPKLSWGNWGAFINPLKSIKIIKNLGGNAFIKPCTYGTPYNNNDHELYWLYITKNENKIKELCLG